MNPLDRPFGKEEPQCQAFNADQFMRAFKQFVNANTWDESQRIVERTPLLLDPEADDLLPQLAAAQPDPQARQVVEEHRALLHRCREVGIDQAFTDKKGSASGSGLDVPAELQSTLQELGQSARRTDMARHAQLCRQALILLGRNEKSWLWATLQNKLGNSLAQSLSGDRAENLEQAIVAYRQALKVRTRQALPVEWAQVMVNLARAYSDRTPDLAEGDLAENLEQAIVAYRQALEVLTPDELPDYCRRAACGLANLCFAEERYADVIVPYRLAMRAAENLLQASLGRSSKEIELAEIQGLPVNAAYALARLGRLEEAVEALEAGRARLLAEALEANRRDLERLESLGHGALLARYRTASSRIGALQAQTALPSGPCVDDSASSRDFATLSQDTAVARGELGVLITEIRQVELDGEQPYADFFLPPTFTKIQQAAASDAPLVYLLTTPVGSLALVVSSASQTSEISTPVSNVWLDGFTEADLDAILFDADGEGRYLQGAFFGNTGALTRSLAQTLPLLGQQLLDPLAQRLEALKVRQMALIPVGRLALLPLHAAPLHAVAPQDDVVDDQTFQDRFSLAYAPSALALLRSRGRRETPGRSFLAVGNPNPQPYTDIPLLFTQLLVDEISQRVQAGPPLARGAATVAAVQAALAEGPGHLLFGCHGVYEAAEPLRSGLELADGRLTLGQILDSVRLPATELAVLCACQSSLSDFRSLPDEAVGLPAGFLQAGARAVIAALWPVDALPTVLLLRRFYDQLLAGEQPAAALSCAAVWLRKLGRPTFDQEVAVLCRLADAETAFYLERAAGAFAGEHPFASPIYWAAFTFNGALASEGDPYV